MKNEQLKIDLKGILENPSNIESIGIGSVGGNSIEIVLREPKAFESYIYYDKVEERDADLKELEEKIKGNK